MDDLRSIQLYFDGWDGECTWATLRLAVSGTVANDFQLFCGLDTRTNGRCQTGSVSSENSLAQVDWRGEGFGSASLDYIAYQYGFFFDEHRAENDCFALMEVLQQHLPKSGDLVLKSILHKLGQKSYTVYATGSPYETKDILKSRGYRWDGERKSWHTTVTGDEAIKDETCWLKSHIYDGNKAKIEIEVNTCLTQFSNRIGNRVTSEI